MRQKQPIDDDRYDPEEHLALLRKLSRLSTTYASDYIELARRLGKPLTGSDITDSTAMRKGLQLGLSVDNERALAQKRGGYSDRRVAEKFKSDSMIKPKKILGGR